MIRAGHDFEADLSTGKVFVVVESLKELKGFALDKPSIVVPPVAIHTKDYMDSLCHECAHMSLPNATEAEVSRIAADITEVLWKRGYRLPLPKKRKKVKDD
jgi:hypothetical protein